MQIRPTTPSLPAGEVPFLLDQPEQDRKRDEQQRDRAGRAVGGRRLREHLRAGFIHRIGVEGAGHHVRKRRDDEQREQPAEQQEQLLAELADVFFDDHAHRFAFVLDAGIQRAEIRDGAEEDAADQHPEQNRKPAENRSLNRAGNGTGAGNGAELVAEYGPAVCRDVVLAVVFDDGGRFRLGVDPPLARDPPPVKRIGRDEADRRDQDNNECVHFLRPSLLSISVWDRFSLDKQLRKTKDLRLRPVCSHTD